MALTAPRTDDHREHRTWQRDINRQVNTLETDMVGVKADNLQQSTDILNLQKSLSGGLQMEQLAGYWPYVLDWPPIPPSYSFTVEFPRLIAWFAAGIITVGAWSHTFAANTVNDVFLDPSGAVHYEASALDAYTSLPRYDEKIHLCRVESGPVKVLGVYLRYNPYPIQIDQAQKVYNLDYFAAQHVIPVKTADWGIIPVVKDDVILATTGDLWRVVTGGTLDAIEPPEPSYNIEDILGVAGFGDVYSGTATLRFAGRTGFEGALRLSNRAGINWYFANIAAGFLADDLPPQIKNHLLAGIRNCIKLWVSGVAYQVGMKVAGSNTAGRVWECVTPGTTGATVPFPAGAAVGDTATDSTVVWKCIGTYNGSAQWFFKDTTPTMREAKNEDSHDSYAATFLWAVCQYLDTTNDTTWLSDASAHVGYTNAQVLKEILYYNISTQIDTGLTKVFQQDEAPWGGLYSARYLMDNCEVYAGIVAAKKIFTDYASDPTLAATMETYRQNMLTALEGLYDPVTGAYRFELNANMGTAPEQALFYPWVMSQFWPPLWDVPLDRDRLNTAYAYGNSHYPQWWARNDIDSLPALGAHLGWMKVTRNRRVLDQILERVETNHLLATSPDLYVHDAAYYLTLNGFNF